MNLVKKICIKDKILTVFIITVLTIYILFLNILNIYTVIDQSVYKYMIIVIPIILLCSLLAYKIEVSPVIFLVGIFLISFMLKAIFVLVTNTQPVSDFKGFYDYAARLANGDTSWSKWSYFSVWAYQTGPISYYAILMKIFGTGLLPLKLSNCFFMAGTNSLIYLIARKITGEKAARCSALLYMCYPTTFFLAPVLSNQQFAAFMFFAAIYVLMIGKVNWALRGIISGVLAALGNVVRPIGAVVVVALIVWGIIELIENRKLVIVKTIAVFLIVYLITLWGVSSYLINKDISPYGLSNNFPLWKFVVGLNYKTTGQFSYEDQNNIFIIQDSEKRNEAARAAIKERLSISPKQMSIFLIKKQWIMWGGMDTLRWTFYVYKDGKLVLPEGFERLENRMLKTEKMYYFSVLLLLLIGLIHVLKKKNCNTTTLYLSLLLLAYYFAHILIEVQVRYRYFAMIAVFILLSHGAQFIFEKFKLINVK